MRISGGQLLSLLFISRIFATITFFTAERQSIPVVMVTAAVSVAADAVLFLPAIWLNRRFPQDNIVTAAFKLSPTFGWFLFGLYGAAAVFTVFKTVRHFLFFFENAFSSLLPMPLAAVLIFAAAAYASYLGAEALSRAAGIVLGLFFIMLVPVFSLTISDADMINLYAEPTDAATLWQGIINGVSRSSELLTFALWLPLLKGSAAKCAYGFLALKLAVTEAVLVVTLAVLGSFADTSMFPFFTLCSYAKSSFIERLDAVFLVVWTLMAIMKLSFSVGWIAPTAARLRNFSVPRLLPCVFLFLGTIPACLCAYFEEMVLSFAMAGFSAAVFFALGAVVPFVICLIGQRRCDGV